MREFSSVTNTAEAHATTLLWAKAMAHTCIDILVDKELLDKIKQLHAK